MSLPIEFVASATALECYLACPRRFRHRYIDRTPAAGPARSVAEPMRRGDLFHKLVAWDGLGLDTRIILDAENDPELEAIWDAYQAFQSTLLADSSTIMHNVTLSAHCGPVAIEARIDALVTGPDAGVTIYDWKTSPWPNRERLTNSAQSRVYPWVVWHAGVLDDSCSEFDLVYWFPGEPDDPLRLSCDHTLISNAADWLTGIIGTISADTRFEMTPYRLRCQTCEYLAHCGVQAERGQAEIPDEDWFFDAPADDDSFEGHWRTG